MDMDGKFHIHGNRVFYSSAVIAYFTMVASRCMWNFTGRNAPSSTDFDIKKFSHFRSLPYSLSNLSIIQH